MLRNIIDAHLARNLNQTKFLIVYFISLIGLAVFFIGTTFNIIYYKFNLLPEDLGTAEAFMTSALPGLIYIGVVTSVESVYWFYNWVTDFTNKRISFITKFISKLDDSDTSENTYALYFTDKAGFIAKTLCFHTVFVSELTIITMIYAAGYFDNLLILGLLILSAFIIRAIVRRRQGDSSRDI